MESEVRRMRHEGLWEGQVPWQQVLHWLEQAGVWRSPVRGPP